MSFELSLQTWTFRMVNFNKFAMDEARLTLSQTKIKLGVKYFLSLLKTGTIYSN